jgi:hypothetical protein
MTQFDEGAFFVPLLLVGEENLPGSELLPFRAGQTAALELPLAVHHLLLHPPPQRHLKFHKILS